MTASLPLSTNDEFARFAARFAAALAGQYDLECEIGRGGMGIVYRARDVKLDRRVAVKTLPPHLANDDAVRERFLREARTAGALSHQHIVPVHRADELGGQVFFVMGYVEGESLAQRLQARGPLAPIDVVRHLRDVADALAYAHARGVVHRDIKLENILIEATTGSAMVTDFGIARLAEAAPLTATGQVLGTVHYLSPEQVSGETVDARSDIYSLGVAGYMALSGKFPFDAPLASAVLIAHVTKSAPPLHTVAPQVPRALCDLIDRMLSKNPDERPQSCGDVVALLNAMTDDVAWHVPTAPTTDIQATSAAPLVSDTEAHVILGRAAEMQALTGLAPRPDLSPALRDAERDAARTSGHQVANLRDAAVEAGIAGRYVDRALAERGLAPSTAPARPVTIVDRTTRPNPLLGAATLTEFEVVIDGEVPTDDYDLFVDVIRRHMKQPGITNAVGRSFTWYTSGSPTDHRLIQVSVLPRNGKTTIQASERMNKLVGALFGGIMGGWGMGSTGIWLGLATNAHHPGVGVLLWGANALASYGLARKLFARKSRKRQHDLRAMVEDLAAQARASIAAHGRLLPGETGHGVP